MAIQAHLENGVFRLEQVTILVAAFERALQALAIDDRKGSEAMTAASAVVDMAEAGLTNPDEIAARVISIIKTARDKLE